MGKSSNLHKILVVGLPPGSTSADLAKLVKPVGNPLNASLAVDADGKERGFGFVQFADAATQQAAIAALDKTALAGRTLNVRAVEERGPNESSSKRPAGGERGRPCYDFARGKCARGASCRWAHVAPPSADDAEAVRSRRPEWQKKRSGATDAASVLADIPDDLCRKFQMGSCHRGEACRWKHVLWSGGGSGKCEPAAAAVDKAAAAKRPRPDGSAASSGVAPQRMRIGGSGVLTPAAKVDDLRLRLKQREVEWREAHPEHPADEGVPEAMKRRDVVWKSMERQLAKALEQA